MLLVHGTTIEIEGQAVLIRGPSGAGKSDLALRLIDRGAVLVADDQTELVARDGRLIASAPAAIAGMIEARGLGIVLLPHRGWAPLALAVDLVAPEAVERLPDPVTVEYLGIAIPLVRLAAFEASATAKVRLAVLSPTRDIMRP